MFFEEEKDILDIEKGADIEISEDGTVTWEDVLNDVEEDLVSVKQPMKTNQSPQNVNLGSELELVEDDEEVDDKELAKILNSSNSSNNSQYQEELGEDFDIDDKLANAAMSQNQIHGNEEEIIMPRKEERRSSGSAMPYLLALLVALGVAGGCYYYFTTHQQNTELSHNKDIPGLAAVQQQLNNATAEDIINRADANTINKADDANETITNEAKPEETKAQEKEEEQQLPEKKQVINVTPTGRANPFMPISKYIAVKIDDTVVDFDKVGIPKPPEEYGQPEPPVTKMMTIVISGIMYDNESPCAIITLDNNDYFVQKGDMLDDYKILEIGRSYVVIGFGKNTYKANIGEEFKISTEIEGNAPYISGTNGRKYQTVGNAKPVNSVQKTGRYVSESEVEINAR